MAHKYDHIVKLFGSSTFSAETLVHHLKENYEADGVRDFLINRLYNIKNKDAFYYMPALMSGQLLTSATSTTVLPRRVFSDT